MAKLNTQELINKISDLQDLQEEAAYYEDSAAFARLEKAIKRLEKQYREIVKASPGEAVLVYSI